MAIPSSDCHPLSLTREIGVFPIGNLMLMEHHRRIVGDHPVKVHPEAWIHLSDLSNFLEDGASTLVDTAGFVLAWRENSLEESRPWTGKHSFMIRYPWDLLRANEAFVSALEQNDIAGSIHPAAVVEGIIQIGEGTRILPGVFIEGNVVIGKNCKIGPNCYIRGNTTIGDQCHIGQSVEIKNCLILSRSNVGHLSYVGDSVLGEGVNLGAGTTTSNLRHDGKNHFSKVHGVLVDTGRRKLGAIIADGVHTGINTSLYPGRKLWPYTTTRPGEIVQDDLLP